MMPLLYGFTFDRGVTNMKQGTAVHSGVQIIFSTKHNFKAKCGGGKYRDGPSQAANCHAEALTFE